jgi:4-oxalocrotonate tautomerase
MIPKGKDFLMGGKTDRRSGIDKAPRFWEAGMLALSTPPIMSALSSHGEGAMPFVNIRIVKGTSDEAKSRIAKSVAKAISGETGIPLQAIWVVFEDVRAEEWFVGERSVAEMRRSGPS